jgi:hypothetical protein
LIGEEFVPWVYRDSLRGVRRLSEARGNVYESWQVEGERLTAPGTSRDNRAFRPARVQVAQDVTGGVDLEARELVIAFSLRVQQVVKQLSGVDVKAGSLRELGGSLADGRRSDGKLTRPDRDPEVGDESWRRSPSLVVHLLREQLAEPCEQSDRLSHSGAI